MSMRIRNANSLSVIGILLLLSCALKVDGKPLREIQVIKPNPSVRLYSATANNIEGIDGNTKIRFISRLRSENEVVVDIFITEERQITAELYMKDKSLTIKSYNSQSKTPFQLSAEDISSARQLLSALNSFTDSTSFVADALLSLLNYISSASPGYTLNFTTRPKSNLDKREAERVKPLSSSIISLCSSTGLDTFAEFIVNGFSIRQKQRVGQCFNNYNAGRCGAGPGPDALDFSQRFTQDCFDHDFCCVYVGQSGMCGSECESEYFEAADDFLFGKDCAAMAGNWYDDDPSGYVNAYNLTGGEGGFQVSTYGGTITSPVCSVYNVNPPGTRSIANPALSAMSEHNAKATPTTPVSGCVTNSYFKGSYSGCNQIDGIYNNDKGGTNSLTLFRGRKPGPPGSPCGGVCN